MLSNITASSKLTIQTELTPFRTNAESELINLISVKLKFGVISVEHYDFQAVVHTLAVCGVLNI